MQRLMTGLFTPLLIIASLPAQAAPYFQDEPKYKAAPFDAQRLTPPENATVDHVSMDWHAAPKHPGKF